MTPRSWLYDESLQEPLELIGFTDFGLIPFLIFGLKQVMNDLDWRWFTQTNDKEKYGEDPLVIRLIAQLEDPWSLAQVAFIRDIHCAVLRIMFVLARKHEDGGGTRYQLKRVFFLTRPMLSCVPSPDSQHITRTSPGPQVPVLLSPADRRGER